MGLKIVQAQRTAISKAVNASPLALLRLRNVQLTRDTGLGEAPDAQIRTSVFRCFRM